MGVREMKGNTAMKEKPILFSALQSQKYDIEAAAIPHWIEKIREILLKILALKEGNDPLSIDSYRLEFAKEYANEALVLLPPLLTGEVSCKEERRR